MNVNFDHKNVFFVLKKSDVTNVRKLVESWFDKRFRANQLWFFKFSQIWQRGNTQATNGSALQHTTSARHCHTRGKTENCSYWLE